MFDKGIKKPSKLNVKRVLSTRGGTRNHSTPITHPNSKNLNNHNNTTFKQLKKPFYLLKQIELNCNKSHLCLTSV